MKKNVCQVVQWPVHYHAPIYKKLHKLKSINFTVIYCDNITLRGYFDRESQSKVGWKHKELLKGYNFVFLKNFFNHNNDRNFLTLINFSIFSHILKNKYDVVIISGYIGITYILAIIAAKLSGSKLLFKGESTLRNVKNGMFKTTYLKVFFSCFDLLFYSCSGNLKFLNAFSKLKLKKYAPCTVDNNFYRNGFKKRKSMRYKIRQKLGIKKNEIVLLSVGKLYKRKRPLDLLKSVQKVNSNKFCILLVGNGQQKSEIIKYSKENNIKTILTGHLSSTDVIDYFSIADIYLQLSDYDPSPKSLNESMNFSLPLIVTKAVGTCDDLVFNGINGFKVPVGNINQISKAIKKLKQSRIRKKMGLNSYKIISRFSIDKHVSSMEEAIKNLYK